MNCTNHPDKEATGMCAYCGKPFCAECLVEVKGRMYCKEDLGKVFDEAKQTGTGSTPSITITNTSSNVNSNQNGGVIGMPRKKRSVALILCLLGFIGLGGIHRMYVGKVGSGILSLLTCGFCFIGTIIDFISILSRGFRDSYGQPLL